MSAIITNFIIHTGTDFEQSFTLSNNDDKGPLNLNGYTGYAQIKKYEGSLKSTTFTITFINNAEGRVKISLASSITETLKEGNYAYDFIIRDSSNIITKISEGQVFVKKSVTRI